MLRSFFSRHVFANLTFGLILIVGFLAYSMLPRQQDPDMNFNWINIATLLPGASAEEVEKLVTDPLEDALENLSDIRFVISDTSDSMSNIIVRFEDMEPRVFDKRVNDLRREIQNKQRELPSNTADPQIIEITSSNGFPTAMVVVQSENDDENLRAQARLVKRDLERLKGVDKVLAIGLRDPELQIRLKTDQMHAYGVAPTQVADTVASRFHDLAAGGVEVGQRNWLVRLQGTTSDPQTLADWPVLGVQEEITIGNVAHVVRDREKASRLVRFEEKPAILLTVTKRESVNTIELTERIKAYIETRKDLRSHTGVTLALADDQTHMVRNTLAVMETNALLGLMLVMVATWLFLGSRIALLIGLGIPFTLAGVFGMLYSMGETLNVMVLLGVVIALGMLVDDAVVVVEAIYTRLQRGMNALDAGIEALKEVFAPVSTSVLTTMAAFLPLMLLPGILGKFMRVVPMVVTLALAISLIEAFWMLPAHIAALKMNLSKPTRIQRMRQKITRMVRNRYVGALVFVLRRPIPFLFLGVLPLGGAIAAIALGLVRMEFFAMDPFPLYYINVTMPPGTTLDQTMDTLVRVERRARNYIEPGEARALTAYAGQMFTETNPVFSDRYGQIMVSLNPDQTARRSVSEIIDAMRADVIATPGPDMISFLQISGGPPVTKPVSVKVRGDNLDQLVEASDAVKEILSKIEPVSNISDDNAANQPQVILVPDSDAVRRAGISPDYVLRTVHLLSDGELVTHYQDRGEKVEVRVLAQENRRDTLDQFLQTSIALPQGGVMPLAELVHVETRLGLNAIRHYNFRRTITVEADLDKTVMNEVEAREALEAAWAEIQHLYPESGLDFSGILDDINESMNGIITLFLFGIGLMYMILGTQFNSYWQPLMILTTVPMAFTGVVFGLLIAGQPMNLYTLYGVVALSGIAVNASIVLISAANSRRMAGMTALTAIVLAAKRRVIPILITTLTTIAGLFSLATGLGGQSLLWGPIAISIVWGLGVSTLLTLFLVPLLYWTFSRKRG
ncbi:MAG: efflux RND transporter permease subunit [Magnetococcales bacterium]|nr:efflux RND transporter permease subunit [Magnetococcales bacterium]